MGEYNKTYNRISELKKKKRAKQKQIEKLEKWILSLKERIYYIDEEIADCEGYLLELDYIDNGGSR